MQGASGLGQGSTSFSSHTLIPSHQEMHQFCYRVNLLNLLILDGSQVAPNNGLGEIVPVIVVEVFFKVIGRQPREVLHRR